MPQDTTLESGRRWSDGIAIIGMSARFPRSRNVQEFWSRLMAGESLISDFSEADLKKSGVDETTISNPDYVRRGSSIADADCLDAEFFGMSRGEAEIIDPQQRVLLECAWEAMEHSGYTGDGKNVGVFAGCGMNSYLFQLLGNPGVLASAGAFQLMLANDKDFLATRIAYKLNLRGPAVAVQTACSTSLAAVHMACQSILAGECDMALAGGVSISFPQDSGYLYMPGMILSPDGYCRPFDAGANGTVPGRGAGLVVLKKLSQALADEDVIHAVIRGSAWNNDGSAKVGYTVPSVDGQALVIWQALSAAGIGPERIGYVETHGTATELGDPIEVSALSSIFTGLDRAGSCVLGAVKGNMGHADTASGIGGLIKAALAVEAGVIPATLNYSKSNPYAPFEGSPFLVSPSAMPWPVVGERWAGVSSFGIGGTNVHVILSQAPERTVVVESTRPRIFPFSARTPAALVVACGQLADRLESDGLLSAEDVASTLQHGRRSFVTRRAVVANDLVELTSQLRKRPTGREVASQNLAQDVVFLFPGQGQQFIGMAEALYRSDKIFRSTVDEGTTLLRNEFGLDVAGMIAGGSESEALKAYLQETNVAQPVLFLTEYALAARWQSLGVRPSALLGHSLGELTAASIAGVFSFEDGLRLAAERGRLMAETPPGLMLAVLLPPEQLTPYLEQNVWLAAENGPRMTVASGLVDAVEDLERRLAVDRVGSIRLASRNAFHTPLMAKAAHSFRQVVEQVFRQPPTLPWLSNVTGTWIDPVEAQSPQYWGRQILSRVRFTQDLAVLAERPKFLLEVGPGEALIGITRHQMSTSVSATSLGAESRKNSDEIIFLAAAAKAWECGVPLSWAALDPESRRRRVSLPTYPFERQRYWVETAPLQQAARSSPELRRKPAPSPDQVSASKRKDISSWFYAPSWQSTPPASVALRPKEKDLDCWLILLDRSGVGRAAATALRKKGARVVTVTAADRFAEDEDQQFSVNPSHADDYELLWQKITDLGLRPEGLLDLWTMRGMEVQTYDTLVHLLQAARQHRQRFRQIEIVADHLESVTGEAPEDVERAEVLGLIRVVALEYGGTACRSIDLPFPADKIDPTVATLLDEIETPGPDLTVAYRNEMRWQKGWSPAPLLDSPASCLRHGGVYLVTGGMGGIGHSFALYLLQHYQARVVVTGRTALPPRDEWASWISMHPGNNSISRGIIRLQALEQSGGKVLFLTANVSSRDAMTAVFSETEAQFGEIHGVFHAAGVAGGGLIASQNIAEAAQGRRPKVQGSIVLGELLKSKKLDFFLLCSSMSSIVPGMTQSAYAAANVFQDYYAHYCRKVLKLPATAVNFDAWREVGMLVDWILPDGFESAKKERLRIAMETSEGMEVIQRILSRWNGPQIAASTVELSDMLEQRAIDSIPKESVSAVEQESTAELTAILDIWKELLATPEIVPTDNFFELGGHSLMGTMVIARIRDRFGVVLTLRTLFDAPTPETLAAALHIARTERAAPAESDLALSDDREEFEI